MNFSFINTRWILASTIRSSFLNIDWFIKKEVFEVDSTKDLICKLSSKYADFLFKCLFKAKISNQPNSENLNDGLKLKSTYITNILKCVPPGDKPKIEELNNCSKYFDSEIYNLKKLKTIIALGKVAFDNCVKFYKKKYNLKQKIKFIHGKSYLLPGNIKLIACYHPSPRNVNTKLISEKMIIDLFKKARKISMN